jgi:predicted lipid-binding transport protein (Tim44 family)
VPRREGVAHLEVEMAEDADSSGLIALMWAAWIYWNIYLWLDYVSSPGQPKTERLGNRLSEPQLNDGLSLATALVPPSLEALIFEIVRRDGARTVEDFLTEMLERYEAIVAAFDAGNRELLQNFAGPEVYGAFSEAIATRELKPPRRVETVFSKIEAPEIIGGLIDAERMEVCIRFASEAFRLTAQTDGIPVRRQCIDVWTFARPLSSPRGAWLLVATEAGP